MRNPIRQHESRVWGRGEERLVLYPNGGGDNGLDSWIHSSASDANIVASAYVINWNVINFTGAGTFDSFKGMTKFDEETTKFLMARMRTAWGWGVLIVTKAEWVERWYNSRMTNKADHMFRTRRVRIWNCWGREHTIMVFQIQFHLDKYMWMDLEEYIFLLILLTQNMASTSYEKDKYSVLFARPAWWVPQKNPLGENDVPWGRLRIQTFY